MKQSLAIKEALDKSTEFLRKKGSSSPRLDAEVLLSHIVGLSRLQLYLQFDRPLTEKEKEQYRGFLKRRAEHEPVAYITGEKEFHSLSFHVTPAVLIPRPDTEILVEEAIKKIREQTRELGDKPPRVFEVGTGSGAVAISVLKQFPDLIITGSDISAPALAVANKNAERHGVSNRLSLVRGDLFAGEAGPFDLIVSNPPYIAETEKNSLPPDIIKYEPPSALLGGRAGLDVILRVIFEGENFLSPGGWILVEIGKGQYINLKSKIEEQMKFQSVQAVEDYTGTVRVLCVKK